MKLLGKRTRKGEEGSIKLIPEEGELLPLGSNKYCTRQVGAQSQYATGLSDSMHVQFAYSPD